MAQIFNRSTNAISRLSIWGAAFILAGVAWAASVMNRSAYNTGQGVTIKQPVPFSHEHHVSGLGIDCRYCHTAVEKSSNAGIPPTATCMNCHKLIWNDSPLLEPVRESFRSGRPLNWAKVYALPDFVYFDHSIHVNKGIGCVSCHGRIDRMQLTRQYPSLQMEWCLACHREPEKNLRPKDRIFDLAWKAGDQAALGAALRKEYGIRSTFALTNCSTCHR
ncbi:MAG TPA: cytochrome c3 family protein [Thermoanaerobaculia bacterium]|nr:cytochrome c3 family protein [Thermoanaerobaculia bacterium]